MTNRELLELAAKAAGIKIDPIDAMHEPDEWACWNPLQDDGDAFRLAVMLGIDYKVTETACHISFHDDMAITVGAQYAGNIYAATRRAITRAAAEIGASKCK